MKFIQLAKIFLFTNPLNEFLNFLLKNVHTYGTRRKECNKRRTAALEKMAYITPAFSTPKVPHFDGCAAFCREMFAELRRVWPKAPQFRMPALPAQTIKVQHDFHRSVARKSGAQILQIVTLFLTRTVSGNFFAFF